MRYLIIIALLILVKCNTTYDDIEGGWELVRHDFYDLNKNQEMTEGDKPFQLLFFAGDSVFIDNEKGLYSLKEDTIIFSIKRDIVRFAIKEKPDRMMLLTTTDFTPGTMSYYYLRRASK